MKIHVLIQARSSSKRLPFKSLLNIDKYFSIELLYKRIKSKMYNTTVLISKDTSDDYFAHLLNKKKINLFRGSLFNVKKRFLSFTKKFKNEDIIIRLTGDNLFIDKKLIKLAIKELITQKKDYLFISNKFSNLPLGISVEIFRYLYLKKNNNFSKLDKEHVTYSFDKHKNNSIKIREEKKFWKKLVCTMDYLENYHLIKKTFESIKNPLTISWQKLLKVMDKIKRKKVNYKNDFKLISIQSKKLTKKIIIDISKLKMQEWNFSLKSHIKYFNDTLKENEINNMIYLNDKLIGYTLHRKKKLYKSNSYVLIDTVIINKNYRKKNLGTILMNFNNNEIIKSKLPAYLQCKTEHIKFYKNFSWKEVDKKNKILIQSKSNLRLMSFN
tara:strand:- start:2526 stop:3674 length:1149 start_codon:yes stop_codon:yes gene_type:complete